MSFPVILMTRFSAIKHILASAASFQSLLSLPSCVDICFEDSGPVFYQVLIRSPAAAAAAAAATPCPICNVQQLVHLQCLIQHCHGEQVRGEEERLEGRGEV